MKATFSLFKIFNHINIGYSLCSIEFLKKNGYRKSHLFSLLFDKEKSLLIITFGYFFSFFVHVSNKKGKIIPFYVLMVKLYIIYSLYFTMGYLQILFIAFLITILIYLLFHKIK
jgi:hypothetical protein